VKVVAGLLLAAAAFGAAHAAEPGDSLAARAADLRGQHEKFRHGRSLEYDLARSGLDSCDRALRLFTREERETECREAQRRVEACATKRDAWVQALDVFTVDALAAGQSARHAGLIKLTLPACPSTLPNGDTPGAALAALGRSERRAQPSYPVCESYLRAMITAADEDKAALVESLALDLVERCGADHPDYRRQADAALIRVGRDTAVLDRPRPAARPASASSAL